MSSESMLPSKPKSAPEAPTEIFDCINRAESKLPPNPEMIYNNPTRTVKQWVWTKMSINMNWKFQ